jgi:hypothetical protein
MVDEFELDAKIGEYINYKTKFTGKKAVSESAPTPAYSSVEYLFRARDIKVYLSDTEGSWGTALDLESLRLTITKNLYVHQSL